MPRILGLQHYIRPDKSINRDRAGVSLSASHQQKREVLTLARLPSPLRREEVTAAVCRHLMDTMDMDNVPRPRRHPGPPVRGEEVAGCRPPHDEEAQEGDQGHPGLEPHIEKRRPEILTKLLLSITDQEDGQDETED